MTSLIHLQGIKLACAASPASAARPTPARSTSDDRHRAPTGADTAWCMPRAPRVAARARIAHALFLRAVRGLPLRVVLPDGATVGRGGAGRAGA